MNKLLSLIIIGVLLLPGCAYYGHTTVTTKAKNVKAIAGGVPFQGDADVIVTRECWFTLWYKMNWGKDE